MLEVMQARASLDRDDVVVIAAALEIARLALDLQLLGSTLDVRGDGELHRPCEPAAV